MRPPEIVSQLGGFRRRGPGTDAERRAAGWLADQLREAGREPVVETFWCRPSWAFAHAWHVATALAGSLISVASAPVGVALLLVALISAISDALIGVSAGRRLTPERASQNVIGPSSHNQGDPGVRLIVTANYDAGRTGVVYRKPLRTTAAWLNRATRAATPGWLGWLCIAIGWLLVIALVRLEGHHGPAVGVIQFPPTVALVLGLGVLVDIASADYGPAAGDNGSGVAVALALVRALDAAPPRRLAVELVLQGAGEGGGTGLRRYLRKRARELRPQNSIVLGVSACGEGAPRWWTSDGGLLPLHYARRLRALCEKIAQEHGHLGAAPHGGRGATPALPARMARLPAIAIGCLDERGLAPRSHQRGDVPEAIDAAAIDHAVEFGLILVDAIDALLFARETSSAVTQA